MSKEIFYKSYQHDKYKYIITRAYSLPTDLFPEVAITAYIELTKSKIFIKNGYAWDGASGPAIDTPSFMRGSLVHDALYQLMRENWLDLKYRKTADKLLYTICREDGMNWLRAQWVYHAVRMFGSP